MKLLRKELRLESTLQTSNIHLWSDDNTTVKKFNKIEEILKMHFRVRLETCVSLKQLTLMYHNTKIFEHRYKKRIEHQIKVLRSEFRKIESQVRFIRAVLKNKLELRRKKDVVIQDLVRKFKNPPLFVKPGEENEKTRFDYLLRMPLYSLTNENVEELERKCKEKQKELDVMLNTKPQDVWLKELEEFEKVLKERQRIRLEERNKALTKMNKQVDKSEGKRRKDRKRRRDRKKKKALGRNDSIVSVASVDDDAVVSKKKKNDVTLSQTSVVSLSQTSVMMSQETEDDEDERISLLELKNKLLKQKKKKKVILIDDDDSDDEDVIVNVF